MKSKATVLAVLATFALVGMPSSAVTHPDADSGGPCHVHEDQDVMYCHFETPLVDELLDAPHPIVEAADRVVRVVSGVMSVKAPMLPDADIGFCSTDEDCPKRQKCIAAVCTERVFQPLGTMVDSVQMSMKIGGPGAAVRLRW